MDFFEGKKTPWSLTNRGPGGINNSRLIYAKKHFFNFFTSINTPRCIELLPPCVDLQVATAAGSTREVSNPQKRLHPRVHEKMTIAGKFPFSIGDTYIDSFMVDILAIVMLVNSGGT